MVAVFVVFTSTVEVRISAVYVAGVPMAEHDSTPPCIANRAAGNVTIGGTNRLEIKVILPLMFINWTIPAYINFKQITFCNNTSKHYVKAWL